MNGTECGCGRFFAGMAAIPGSGHGHRHDYGPLPRREIKRGRPPAAKSVSDAVETLTDAMGNVIP